MEQLSKRIAAEISHSLDKSKDEQEIIAYGLLGIFQLISNIGLTHLLGWIFGVPFQALILSFSVSVLRRFSGGAHADSLNLCTLVGLIYSIFFAKVSVYFAGSPFSLWISMGFSALIMILAWITVAARAPVDSPHKPIKSEAKKKRMRKGSFQTLAFLTIVVIFLFIVGCSNKTVLSYGFSLVFGVLWQTFSLTIPGAKLLNNLNKISRKKEVKQE